MARKLCDGRLVKIYCEDNSRNNVVAEIYSYENKFFQVYFTDRTHSNFCVGGAYSSINDAMANVEKLRPASKPLNLMCDNCKNTECVGEFNQVYTGCIYKEF